MAATAARRTGSLCQARRHAARRLLACQGLGVFPDCSIQITWFEFMERVFENYLHKNKYKKRRVFVNFSQSLHFIFSRHAATIACKQIISLSTIKLRVFAVGLELLCLSNLGSPQPARRRFSHRSAGRVHSPPEGEGGSTRLLDDGGNGGAAGCVCAPPPLPPLPSQGSQHGCCSCNRWFLVIVSKYTMLRWMSNR